MSYSATQPIEAQLARATGLVFVGRGVLTQFPLRSRQYGQDAETPILHDLGGDRPHQMVLPLRVLQSVASFVEGHRRLNRQIFPKKPAHHPF